MAGAGLSEQYTMRHMAEQRALRLGIETPHNKSMRELIRSIQEAEGRKPCFLSDERYLCKDDCEWAAECRKLCAEWHR